MADGGLEWNQRAVKDFFKKINDNVDDIQKKEKTFWGALAALAFRNVIKHFQDESGPEGRWKAWSRIYAERMQRVGKGGNKILQDTGQMRQMLRTADDRSRISQGILVYNPALTKNGFPYAWAHDTGQGRLPQREFMWMDSTTLNKMSKIMAEYTTEGV